VPTFFNIFLVNKKLIIHRTLLLHKFRKRKSFNFPSYLFSLSISTISSSNTSFAAAVADVEQSMMTFIQLWRFCFFALGVVRHAFNIYIFTRPKFRFNPVYVIFWHRLYLVMRLFGLLSHYDCFKWVIILMYSNLP